MAATSEPSNDDRTVSLPLIDLRLLSQSELYTISLSSSTIRNGRTDDDTDIPKIDRSVFNESAGSRKQTFSRLRLSPRNNNKQKSIVRASSSSRIPDEENSKIISLVSQLFGVEALRGAANDVVPLQVELKLPEVAPAPLAIANTPFNAVEGSQGKRKRGRPRRNETPETRLVDGQGEEEVKAAKKRKTAETGSEKKKKTVEAVKEVVVDDVGDPFGEELIGRTQGMETEVQLMEFMEGLGGEWGSKRKKRRIVDASSLCNVLPTGWKLVLILQRRAGHLSVVCRRYVSPDGRQFESYKEVSSYLVPLFGNPDACHSKSGYTGGSQQFSSNINLALEQTAGLVHTGGMEIDAHASSHHKKQATTTISSPIEAEKINTSDGNLNGDLALVSKSGDTNTGAFRDSDHQTGVKQPLKAHKEHANSVQGGSIAEESVYNVQNEKLVSAIEAGDAACNLYIPMAFTTPAFTTPAFTTPLSNSINAIDQFSDEMNAVTCIKGGIGNFDSQNKNIGSYEALLYGDDQVHFDEKEFGLSMPLGEDHIQKTGFVSSTLVPNSEGEVFAGNNLEDRHLISSLEDIERNDRKFKDDNQQIISSRGQSEIFSSEGSLVQYHNELKHTSTDSMDRMQTSVFNNSAEGNFFGNDFPNSSIDERTFVHSGYTNDVSFGVWPQDDQICSMDNLLHRSTESENNLFTLTDYQHPSAFHDNMNNISAGTFGALQHVDDDCVKPQLGTVSCSNGAAIDASAAPRVLQGRPQGFVSVPPGGSILNQFDKKNEDGVSKENKSCLSEKAKSEVEIFQTDSLGMPKLR